MLEQICGSMIEWYGDLHRRETVVGFQGYLQLVVDIFLLTVGDWRHDPVL